MRGQLAINLVSSRGNRRSRVRFLASSSLSYSGWCESVSSSFFFSRQSYQIWFLKLCPCGLYWGFFWYHRIHFLNCKDWFIDPNLKPDQNICKTKNLVLMNRYLNLVSPDVKMNPIVHDHQILIFQGLIYLEYSFQTYFRLNLLIAPISWLTGTQSLYP